MVKATTPVVETKVAQYGVERSKDLPWNAKKVALFKALRKAKAMDSLSAASASTLVPLGGGLITDRDVRHYSYHAAAGGLVGVNLEGPGEGDEGRGYGFYLTKKGAAINPDKVLKDQEAAKAVKKEKEPKAEKAKAAK